MAATSANFPAVSLHGSNLVERAWGASLRRFQQFRRERHLRLDMAELHGRDERMLRDIGVERDELERAIRTGRRREDSPARNCEGRPGFCMAP